MDACLPDWNSDVGAENPSAPLQKKPLGLENELVELLWQNGEIVMHSQNNRKSKQVTDRPSLTQDEETASWMIDCPIDESFERDFYSNFLFEIPPFDESNKNLNAHHVVPTPQPHQDFPQPPPPPPRFPENGPGRADHEGSGMTVGLSHCASNQVVNEVEMSRASSSGLGSRAALSKGAEEVGRRRINEGVGPAFSGGSGGSSMWKTSSQSNETNRHKRKCRDVEESECPSDATELESGKASQKSGMTRRSRVAEVHNLSERKRRDRINEKMRALQNLIPNANKSDKASMLDEAIEYMKSLQLQIQHGNMTMYGQLFATRQKLMWMGRGMAPMMLPGMQHYMSRVGMGIGPTIPIPAIQNLMRLSRLPLVDQPMNLSQAPNQAQIGYNPMLNPVHYQNHMQNSGFQEQYANYMNFHCMQNASPQATNVYNFGFSPAQQNPVSAPQSNGDK